MGIPGAPSGRRAAQLGGPKPGPYGPWAPWQKFFCKAAWCPIVGTRPEPKGIRAPGSQAPALRAGKSVHESGFWAKRLHRSARASSIDFFKVGQKWAQLAHTTRCGRRIKRRPIARVWGARLRRAWARLRLARLELDQKRAQVVPTLAAAAA